MAPGRRPHEDLLVIRLDDPDDEPRMRERVGGGVELVPVHGPRPLWLVRVPSGANPEERWREWSRRLEGVATVSPALVDEDENVLYPTGEIVVHFREPIEADDLPEFGERHALHFVKRNKFSKRQAVFTPRAPKFLPEVEEEITGDAAVESAVADTVTSFKRG